MSSKTLDLDLLEPPADSVIEQATQAHVDATSEVWEHEVSAFPGSSKVATTDFNDNSAARSDDHSAFSSSQTAAFTDQGVVSVIHGNARHTEQDDIDQGVRGNDLPPSPAASIKYSGQCFFRAICHRDTRVAGLVENSITAPTGLDL